MCGVAGIFAYHYAAPEVSREELRQIRDYMSSRGPDGAGEWYSEDGRVGLGHRRLAIIDLSEKAAQPMKDLEETLIVSFNGEIYNHREIRLELEKKGYTFHSHSDTEVLLRLYQEKGEAMVHDLRGMFAFALWDEGKKVLFLARDPYGIKPLYYADDGWTVRVASQVKALLTSEKVSKLPEPAGIVGFFLMGSVPEPYTTYQEIRQVPAGSTVRVNQLGPSSPKRYFSIAKIFAETVNKTPSPLSPPPQGGEGSEAVPAGGRVRGEVREALFDSIRHHFISDVPVGVFLSGGIDSGSLVGLAYDAGFRNLKTVTLAFEEFRGTNQDEAPLAEEVARTYGTRHHTSFLSSAESKRELPRIFEAMDQPTIDGINTYFVSKAAKEIGLKVALSGLGGDELFGGYPSFHEIPRLVQGLAVPSRIPFLGGTFQYLFRAFSRQLSTVSPKYAGLLKYGGTYPGAYFLRRGLFMPWELESLLKREVAHEGLKRLNILYEIESRMTPDPKTSFGRVATLEASLYMRNQLLRDADWAGMAHSLEIRTPYVDACLLKVLAPILSSRGLNSGYLSRSFNHKSLLAESPRRPLPEKILSRRKTGFNVPIDKWLEANKTLDTWQRIPLLTKTNCPWARRLAYVAMEGLKER